MPFLKTKIAIAVLCVLLLPMGLAAAPSEEREVLHTSATPHLGATTALEACWDPEALRATPHESAVRYLSAPDHTPPERVAPETVAAPVGEEAALSVRSIVPRNGEKLVALTFDLCERASEITGYDGALVDLLRAEQVRATFFAGGKWLRSHPERAMQLMADPLFEIGNHTWTHGNLRVLHGAEVMQQIQWAQAQYELLRERLLHLPCATAVLQDEEKRIPPLPKTFRFPYGTCDAESLSSVVRSGLVPIQWSIVSGDPVRSQTANRISDEVLQAIRPGAIVVAHANGRGWHTREALQTLIPRLRSEGYRFVTVSELLRLGKSVAVDSCYELHKDDNSRYDRLFGRGTE